MVIHARKFSLRVNYTDLNSQICREEFEGKHFFVLLESGFRMVKYVLRKYMHIRFSNVSQFGPVLKSSTLYFPVSGDSAKYKCLVCSRLGVGLVRFKLDYIGPILLMNILKYTVSFTFRYVAWKIVCASVRLANRIMWLLLSRPKSDSVWPFGKVNNKVISLTDIWTLLMVQLFHMTAIRRWVHFSSTGVHQDPDDTRSTKRPSKINFFLFFPPLPSEQNQVPNWYGS
jgi:hypothetical protein